MLSLCPEYEDTLSLCPESLRPTVPCWSVTLSLWLCNPGCKDILLVASSLLEDILSVLPDEEERLSVLLLASEEETLSTRSDRAAA